MLHNVDVMIVHVEEEVIAMSLRVDALMEVVIAVTAVTAMMDDVVTLITVVVLLTVAMIISVTAEMMEIVAVTTATTMTTMTNMTTVTTVMAAVTVKVMDTVAVMIEFRGIVVVVHPCRMLTPHARYARYMAILLVTVGGITVMIQMMMEVIETAKVLMLPLMVLIPIGIQTLAPLTISQES
jgi:hypothetical protein